MFSYCVEERVLQQNVLRYGPCISAKITSFFLARAKFEIELEIGCVAEWRHEQPIW